MYWVNTQAFDMASVVVKKSCDADVLLIERFEERKQTRGGRVLMIGNIFWVIIPFQPEVGNQPHKSREPTKLGMQTEMLRTSHSAKTREASAQT